MLVSTLWAGRIAKDASGRRTFTSIAELKEAITDWAAHWSTDLEPVIWIATAEDIIARGQCGRVILQQIKPQTDQ
jgi:hypothetical protein